MAYLGNSPINRLYSSQAIALTQGQTAVNVTYTPGMCLVFKNGALLDPGTDYTATNGSVITLANAASTGDVLRVLNLAQFAVANALPLSGGTLGGPLTGPASAAQGTAGLIALATTALAQALTDDATALTPKKLADAFGGANKALSSKGYQRLPSGLIVQWGNETPAASTTATYSFPIAFPTICVSIQSTVGIPGGQANVNASPISNTQFQLQNTDAGSSLYTDWMAVGY